MGLNFSSANNVFIVFLPQSKIIMEVFSDMERTENTARVARPSNRKRKKVCVFCAEKAEYIDYKDAGKLRKFISERGKILPRRISGTCAKHQRELNVAIKRARQIALIPYIDD